MPRLPMPAIPAGNLRTLIEELHELHLQAGLPGVRQIARGSGFTHTAVHDLSQEPTRGHPACR